MADITRVIGSTVLFASDIEPDVFLAIEGNKHTQKWDLIYLVFAGSNQIYYFPYAYRNGHWQADAAWETLSYVGAPPCLTSFDFIGASESVTDNGTDKMLSLAKGTDAFDLALAHEGGVSHTTLGFYKDGVLCYATSVGDLVSVALSVPPALPTNPPPVSGGTVTGGGV